MSQEQWSEEKRQRYQKNLQRFEEEQQRSQAARQLAGTTAQAEYERLMERLEASIQGTEPKQVEAATKMQRTEELRAQLQRLTEEGRRQRENDNSLPRVTEE